MSVDHHAEKIRIISNDHGHTQKCNFCVCLKSKTLCICGYLHLLLLFHHFSGISRNSEQKHVLQTITHLMQYMVLETHFWSEKCMTVTVRYAKNLSNIPFLFNREMQAITISRLREKKPLQNAFIRI